MNAIHWPDWPTAAAIITVVKELIALVREILK